MLRKVESAMLKKAIESADYHPIHVNADITSGTIMKKALT